jgi:hypothetical protein
VEAGRSGRLAAPSPSGFRRAKRRVDQMRHVPAGSQILAGRVVPAGADGFVHLCGASVGASARRTRRLTEPVIHRSEKGVSSALSQSLRSPIGAGSGSRERS